MTKNAINLVQIQPENQQIDKLLEFVRRYYTYDEIPFHPEKIRKSLVALAQDPDVGKAFIINIDDRDAGYAVVTIGFDHEFDGRMIWLTDFYLEPDFRGRGLGRIILGMIEDVGREMGALAIELLVEHDNFEAQKLYKKAGFKPFERFPMAKAL